MTSKKLMQSTIFTDFMSDRAVMDVLLDAGDDRLVVSMSDKALWIDLRDDLVISRMTGGFVVLLGRVVIDRFVGGMIGVGVDMVTDMKLIDMRVSSEDSLSFCC